MIKNIVLLEYNFLLNLPQLMTAECIKTYQKTSYLKIQNNSAVFNATFSVSPSPNNKNKIYKIKANDRTPLYIAYNWNGSLLKIANLSQEAAIINIYLS